MRVTGCKPQVASHKPQVAFCQSHKPPASPTPVQVAGKRKKLLADMGAQMAAEVRKDLATLEAGLADALKQKFGPYDPVCPPC